MGAVMSDYPKSKAALERRVDELLTRIAELEATQQLCIVYHNEMLFEDEVVARLEQAEAALAAALSDWEVAKEYNQQMDIKLAERDLDLKVLDDLWFELLSYRVGFKNAGTMRSDVRRALTTVSDLRARAEEGSEDGSR
jgi:hypothetical protein